MIGREIAYSTGGYGRQERISNNFKGINRFDWQMKTSCRGIIICNRIQSRHDDIPVVTNFNNKAIYQWQLQITTYSCGTTIDRPTDDEDAK